MDNAKTVEIIRALCKKKKTSLTRLEEKLGFSNGYIGKIAKRPSSPPYEKLVAIANELEVTVADLTGEKENEKKPTAQGDGLDVDYIEKWIDNNASEEQLKLFIAKASAKLVKK